MARHRRSGWRSLALAALLAAAGPALAQTASAQPGGLSVSASAFGTIAYAQSDRTWRYQRFIDDDGTFERDTVFGAQLDAQLGSEVSATWQVKLAPSVDDDSSWDLTTAWAFVAWRPNNDWLLRAGKLRVPFLLRSEQIDVGQTYDEARLPGIYTLTPTNDFTGVHLTRNWELGGGELSVDAYGGSADLSKRFWLREGVPGQLPAGALFRQLDTTMQGLLLNWRDPDWVARAGVHYASTRGADGATLPVRPVWVDLAPGIGYWQTSNSLPGPGVQEVRDVRNVLFNLGAEVRLRHGWRVAAEVARVIQRDTELGVDATAGYVTVYRSIGRFTPYATVSAIRSNRETLAWARALDTTTVPSFVPGAALLNASMRVAADTLPVYRQHSLGVGTSYALTPRSKLKLDWLNTHAHLSQLVDVPAGEPLERRRRVNVLTVGYSFVF